MFSVFFARKLLIYYQKYFKCKFRNQEKNIFSRFKILFVCKNFTEQIIIICKYYATSSNIATATRTQILLYRKKDQRSSQYYHLNKLSRQWIPNAVYEDPASFLSSEEEVFYHIWGWQPSCTMARNYQTNHQCRFDDLMWNLVKILMQFQIRRLLIHAYSFNRFWEKRLFNIFPKQIYGDANFILV